MSSQVADWLLAGGVPLRFDDSEDADFADLAAIGEWIGGARVVAIGESAHGVHEFYELKHRLLRYLVTELGFSAFVMESGLPEGLRTDRWVNGSDDSLDEVLFDGITYRMGGCEEMRRQLQWMRSWNEANPAQGVRFYGMDIPGSAVDGRPAVKAALDYLERVDEPVAKELRATLDASLGWLDSADGPGAVLAAYMQLGRADQAEMAAAIADLVTHLRTMRVRFAELSSADEAEVAHRCALVAQQWQGFLASMTRGAGARDAAMADNVEWILGREERIVIGAHNGHVQRVPLGAPFPPMTPLGQHLAAALGSDLFVIGTTMTSGKVANHRKTGPGPADVEKFLDDLAPPEPSTIDALLSTRATGPYAVNLRDVPATGPVADAFAEATSIRVNHSPVPVEPLRAFDAIVHFDEVSPVERL